MLNANATIDVTQKLNFTLTSECEEQARITIESDLTVLPSKQFTLESGGETTLTLDPTATVISKNGMLGVYPVKVTSLSTAQTTSTLFDVVVKDDSSCFDLSSAIFDLRSTNKTSGTITNKCFSGRKDNFYPRASFSTDSVIISYNKPGNPEFIDFNATVIGSALESQVQCAEWAALVSVYSSGNDGPSGALHEGKEVGDMVFERDFKDYCEEKYYAGEAIEKPEPDLNITNPAVPLYRMPTKKDYAPTRITAEAENNVLHASFERVELTNQVNTDLFPNDPSKGTYGEIMPNAAVPTLGYDGFTNIPHRLGHGHLIDIYLNFLEFGKGKFLPEQPKDSMNNYVPTETTYNGIDLATTNRWLSSAPIWAGEEETWTNKYTKTSVGGPCEPCTDSLGTNLDYGKNFFQQRIKGEEPDDGWGVFDYIMVILDPFDLFGTRPESNKYTSVMTTQFESLQTSVPIIERRVTWEKPVSLRTVEGVVQDLGKYSANPVPKWTNITEWDNGLETGESEEGINYIFSVIGLHNNGFVNPESVPGAMTGCVLGDTKCENNFYATYLDPKGNKKVAWVIRPAEDPLVEYDGSGKTMYYIPQNKIPGYIEGKPYVRMFLKNGHIYAEYIGLPQIASNTIDFNITKINLLGENYELLTVSDWVERGGELVKETQTYQIKLKGNKTNCFMPDGTPGASGREFVPKILFNWDWNGINYNQCDVKNNNSTYCDATQFSISLFKRLGKIDELLKQNKPQEVPKYASFYAYLTKDNYSQDFLTDFDEYYSSIPFTTSEFFNSVGENKGYDTFITNNALDGEKRIQFMQRGAGGETTLSGNLPKPGVYRVEINLELENENTPALITSTGANAKIQVAFKFEQAPKNDNPFYVLPFDGMVGSKGTTFVRKDYGVGVNILQGEEFPLTQANIVSNYYENALTRINYKLEKNLSILDNSVVLSYSSMDNELVLAKSKPIPLIATINSTNGKAKLAYSIEGASEGTQLSKDWILIESTIGRNTCADFENNARQIYSDSFSNGQNSLVWNGTKPGEIKLATIIFAPTNNNPVLNLKNKSDPALVSIKSYADITSPGAIQLTDSDTGYSVQSLKEVFDAIADGKMCMTQNSQENLKVWWNKAYVDSLIAQVNVTSTVSCGENN